MLITRPDIAPLEKKDIIAFIPVIFPIPYQSFSSKTCPFCNGVGCVSEDDFVTCFKCDYTVKLSVWEGR